MPAFELQPHLEGKLIRLRPLQPEDFEKLFECAADPLIWDQHPQPTRYQPAVFQGFLDSAVQSKGAVTVLDRATGEILGSSRFYDFKPDEDRITIGYTFLVRKCWGGQFNGELKHLMLGHAFKCVSKAVFEIGEKNLRSRRAIEKIGGRLVSSQVLDGKAHVLYVIEREGFGPDAKL